MGTSTAIAWTDHTFNPWMGCTKVSPGCDNCYAESLNKRTGKAKWGDDAERVRTSDAYWRNPLRWDAQAEADGYPHLVFCASLADVFEDRRDLDQSRCDLFALIERTPHLIWQLLTKRPQNVAWLAPARWLTGWPGNVWVGTTVEDQQRADERIRQLLPIPAPVRFLSCEPLLEAVDIRHALGAGSGFVNWVIAGGESGPGHRSLDGDHARSLRDQCAAADVPFFFKQHGGRTPTAGGDVLDDQVIKQLPGAARRG